MTDDPTCGAGVPKKFCGKPARSMIYMQTYPVNGSEGPYTGVAFLCADHDYAQPVRPSGPIYRGGNVDA